MGRDIFESSDTDLTKPFAKNPDIGKFDVAIDLDRKRMESRANISNVADLMTKFDQYLDKYQKETGRPLSSIKEISIDLIASDGVSSPKNICIPYGSGEILSDQEARAKLMHTFVSMLNNPSVRSLTDPISMLTFRWTPTLEETMNKVASGEELGKALFETTWPSGSMIHDKTGKAIPRSAADLFGFKVIDAMTTDLDPADDLYQTQLEEQQKIAKGEMKASDSSFRGVRITSTDKVAPWVPKELTVGTTIYKIEVTDPAGATIIHVINDMEDFKKFYEAVKAQAAGVEKSKLKFWYYKPGTNLKSGSAHENSVEVEIPVKE